MRTTTEPIVSPKNDITFPHPLPHGATLESFGGHFNYKVIGPCCRLFDRAELPWPCCRIQWRGKEPSWRRIGRRFVADMASRQSPSYAVQLLDAGKTSQSTILTLYAVKLTKPSQEWWYGKR